MLRCLLAMLLMSSWVFAQAKTEKLYTVDFDNTSWDKVIEWLEKETGLMCITKKKPTGRITMKPNKKFTIGELTDLVNELLEPENLVILRKAHSFSFYPADQRIPISTTPTVTPEELQKRGKTEYVQFVIKLEKYTADEVIDQVKKTLSPFGTVQSFGTDQLLVRDKAAYVRYAKLVLDTEVTTCGQAVRYACKFQRASYVAEMLRILLSDCNSKFIITVDDATNSLKVTGPADKHLATRDLLKQLDQGERERPVPGKASWVTYNGANGFSEVMAKQILSSKTYLNSSIHAIGVGGNQVYVYAYEADHLEISQLLKTPSVTIHMKPVTVDVAQVVCQQPTMQICQPIRRFHLFPLRKCR